MIVVTDNACTGYESPGHPENAKRVSATVRHLQKQVEINVDWAVPVEVPEELLLRAHTAKHLERLERQAHFDADTLWHPDIAGHARRSVGAALAALDAAEAGGTAFSLMRPPGHHATKDQAMGFCYLNQAAVVALEARARGVERVVVFDFDVHHGNGTEDILLGREGCAYFSFHQHPCYPGTGTTSRDNCRNYPVPPGTASAGCREVLERILKEVAVWKPGLVVVSAGFDAFEGDPLAQLGMIEADYEWLGGKVAGLGIPHLHILEGGYSLELPHLILAYLLGLETPR